MVWPPQHWSASIDAPVAPTGLLVLASVAGMAQERTMGLLRRRALSSPADIGSARAVRRGTLLATILRAVMAVPSSAVVVLAAVVISR